MEPTSQELLNEFAGIPIEDQTAAERARLLQQNAFIHNANNMVQAGKDYVLDFMPNVLDNYDQYTYHWKLFITSLENSRTGDVLEPINQVVIAESGVTDLTIDNVEMHGIAIPSVEAGTGTQTLVKFDITEPSGAMLLDKMFYQAVGLGIGNWLVMPCYLQLEFRGRRPSTSESYENGQLPEVGRWIWPIKLTGSKVHVTHAGSKYNFDAIMYNELSQSNSYFAIQHSTMLNNLNKFGDAMKVLESKLNSDQYDKLIENYSIPDRYTIVVDPALANLDIADKNTVNTAWTRDYIKFNEHTASYNAGTGIDKIVDSLLVNTDYFQEAMQQADTPDGTPRPANAEKDLMKKLWRVVTETHPLAYDVLRQDNAVDITIFIVKYDLGVMDVSAAQTGQTPETLLSSKRRFAEYINKKILRKRYNYIFTGLNDQVENFDLNMNFSFAASLARFGGEYYDSATQQPGISMAKGDADKLKNAKAALSRAIGLLHNAKNLKEEEAILAVARKSIYDTNINNEITENLIALLDNAKSDKRTGYIQARVNKSLAEAAKYARYLAKPVSLTNSAGQEIGRTTFVSDVDITDEAAKEAHKMYTENRNSKLRPIVFREAKNESSAAFGVSPSKDAGRSRSSNIFSTALYTSLDASLVSINLTIKGDPYWLFPAPVPIGQSKLVYRSQMLPEVACASIRNTANAETVNTEVTDNFLILRFRAPRIYDDVTGVVTAIGAQTSSDKYNEVETFSGVYKVVTILSKFEMGKFTQTLSCILDPMINLVDFLAELEEDVKKPDRTVYDPPDVSLPITSIKSGGRIITVVDEAGFSYVTNDAFIDNISGVDIPKSNIPSEEDDPGVQLA